MIVDIIYIWVTCESGRLSQTGTTAESYMTVIWRSHLSCLTLGSDSPGWGWLPQLSIYIYIYWYIQIYVSQLEDWRYASFDLAGSPGQRQSWGAPWCRPQWHSMHLCVWRWTAGTVSIQFMFQGTYSWFLLVFGWYYIHQIFTTKILYMISWNSDVFSRDMFVFLMMLLM